MGKNDKPWDLGKSNWHLRRGSYSPSAKASQQPPWKKGKNKGRDGKQSFPAYDSMVPTAPRAVPAAPVSLIHVEDPQASMVPSVQKGRAATTEAAATQDKVCGTMGPLCACHQDSIPEGEDKVSQSLGCLREGYRSSPSGTAGSTPDGLFCCCRACSCSRSWAHGDRGGHVLGGYGGGVEPRAGKISTTVFYAVLRWRPHTPVSSVAGKATPTPKMAPTYAVRSPGGTVRRLTALHIGQFSSVPISARQSTEPIGLGFSNTSKPQRPISSWGNLHEMEDCAWADFCNPFSGHLLRSLFHSAGLGGQAHRQPRGGKAGFDILSLEVRFSCLVLWSRPTRTRGCRPLPPLLIGVPACACKETVYLWPRGGVLALAPRCGYSPHSLRDFCKAKTAGTCNAPVVPWDGKRDWSPPGPSVESNVCLEDLIWADELVTQWRWSMRRRQPSRHW